jgi:hypothetical protein
MPGARAQGIQERKHSRYRHDSDTIQAKRSSENYQRKQRFGQLIDHWHFPSRCKVQATLEGTRQ